MSDSEIVMRLLAGVAVLLGLILTGVGLVKIVYFERTPGAVISARVGNVLIIAGCVVLIMCAVVAFVIGPRWAALAIAAPVVGCGGLALVAAGTLLPQLAALPTFVLAVSGAFGIVARGG